MSILRNLNCIILIDGSIKSKLKSNIANLVSYGATIVDDVRQINKDMVSKTNRVLIVGTFRYDSLDDLKIYKAILGLDYYFVSDDELMVNTMKNYATSSLLEYSNLNSNLVYSILYGDKGEQSKYLVNDNKVTSDCIAQDVLDSSHDSVISELARDYLRHRDLLRDQKTLERKYIDKISRLESQTLQNLSEIDNLRSSYKNLINKVINQEKALKDFSIYFTEDIYHKVSLSRYKERPLILYFKEYQEMIHENSFLVTLFNSIQLQSNRSCKVVRLHDSCDLVRVKHLEDSYKVINSEFIESEIITSDFILSYGNYTKLFNLLLTNKYKLDVLIILDCKKHDSVVLGGAEMIYFNICRNKSVANYLGLPDSSTILNNDISTLSWDTYSEYDKFPTDQDRFKFLSSRSVIRHIYSLISSYI